MDNGQNTNRVSSKGKKLYDFGDASSNEEIRKQRYTLQENQKTKSHD